MAFNDARDTPTVVLKGGSGDALLEIGQHGDEFPRLQIFANGEIYRGDGTEPPREVFAGVV